MGGNWECGYLGKSVTSRERKAHNPETKLDVLKEWQGSLCVWSGMTEEKMVVNQRYTRLRIFHFILTEKESY